MRPVLEFDFREFRISVVPMAYRNGGYKAHVEWEGNQAMMAACDEPIEALKSVTELKELAGMWSRIVHAASLAAKVMQHDAELNRSLIQDSDFGFR